MRQKWGFTLLELLLVIVIISILASALYVGVSHAITSSMISATRQMIQQIKGGLELYYSSFGDYPPSHLGRFHKTEDFNGVNNGIEALVACVSTKDGGPFYRVPREQDLINLDNDTAPKNLTNWYFGTNQLWEIADPFGNPFIYFHYRDYQHPAPTIRKYILGSTYQDCTPQRSTKTGVFYNPGKFQIWSAGPNSRNQNGVGDDVTGW
jgi:prepilin-type N-terminal cleavage/methylation domain-containing protein